MIRPHNAKLEAREKLMAELADEYAKGQPTLFHGTRHVGDVIRDGVLYPSLIADRTISFTRSAEIAAYFALMPGDEIDLYSGGVLVLDRRRLRRYHYLERFAYEDGQREYLHEEEERVWDEAVVIKHLLIGVVTEADLDRKFKEAGKQHRVGKVMMKDLQPGLNYHECSEADLQRARESYKATREEWRRIYGGVLEPVRDPG
jgi:hypothetical protein